MKSPDLPAQGVASQAEKQAVLLLPPSRRADRAKTLTDLQADEFHPVSAFPIGEEGETLSLDWKQADALIAHGYAIPIRRAAARPDAAAPLLSLKDYVQQYIVDDPIRTSLSRLCRRWHDDPGAVWPHFVPASLTQMNLQHLKVCLGYIEDFDSFNAEAIFNRLWRLRPGQSLLQLSDRMADYAAIDLGNNAAEDDSYRICISWEQDRKLVTRRQLALRCGELFCGLASALATGEMVCQGFLANDHERQVKPIAAAWWGDPAVICIWPAGELRPGDSSPAGTPHYRGIHIRPQQPAGQAIFATGVSGRPSSKHLFMAELKSRAQAATMKASVKEEAACLAKWLTDTYPSAPRATSKTIEEAIRETHRQLKLSPN